MSSQKLELYMPVVVCALTVLFVGYMNPAFMRKPWGGSEGQTDLVVGYKWLAASALVVGGVTVFLQNQKGYQIF